MKEPKGFASFLGEEKKKPEKKKKTVSKKKERKQSNGKDDDRYVSMMDEYKRTRKKDRTHAGRVHEKAIQLKNNGDVSKEAILAGQYL